MTKASLIVTWWMDPMHPTLHDDRFMLGPTGYCDLWFSSRWLRMAMPVCKGIRTLPSRDLHVDFSAKWCVFSLLQQGDVMKILLVFLLSSCPLGIVPLKDTKQQSQFLKVSVPLKYASQKHDRFSGILTETRVFRISTPCLGDGFRNPAESPPHKNTVVVNCESWDFHYQPQLVRQDFLFTIRLSTRPFTTWKL